jgi:hypothetical protein
VLPYLNALGFNPFDFGAKNITDFTLSTPGSRSISTKLPLGGFSISRYCIDFDNHQFTVTTKEAVYHSELVIGSFGKRSNLDVQLNRAASRFKEYQKLNKSI